MVYAGEGNNDIVIGSNSASTNNGTYTSGSGNDSYTIHSGRHTITSGEGDDSFTIKDYAGFSPGDIVGGLGGRNNWFTIQAGNNDTGDKGVKTLNLGSADLQQWTSGAGDDVITSSSESQIYRLYTYDGDDNITLDGFIENLYAGGGNDTITLRRGAGASWNNAVSYTHLRAHET